MESGAERPEVWLVGPVPARVAGLAVPPGVRVLLTAGPASKPVAGGERIARGMSRVNCFPACRGNGGLRLPWGPRGRRLLLN